MIWYKQPTNFLEKPLQSNIIDELGMLGFGVLCAIIQIIAKNMVPGSEPEASYSVKSWARLCRTTPRIVKSLVEILINNDEWDISFFKEKSLKLNKKVNKTLLESKENVTKSEKLITFSESNNDSIINIKYINLLNQKDDYCRKKEPNICPGPDIVRTKSGIDKDKDKDKEPPIAPHEGGDLSFKFALEILDYLNSKTGSLFRAERANISLISNCLKTGVTVDEMKIIVDMKYREWHTDPRFAKHLCPKTLFKPANFEQYYGAMMQESTQTKRKTARKAVGLKRLGNAEMDFLHSYRHTMLCYGMSQEEIDRLYPLHEKAK
jgi:uncharacterized phage protein (TIGR02220 family)